MTATLLSVVIPCYNYAHTLPRAVKSVFEQNRADTEVIVIDDGSTDNTTDVLVSLSQSYPSIKIISQKNAGAAAARNRGIAESTGKWLVFLDADDELLPAALEQFAANIDDSLGLVIAPVISVLEDGSLKQSKPQTIPNTPKERLDAFLNKKLRIHNGGSAMNRLVFAKTRFNETLRQAEDLPVWAHALALFPAKALSKPAARIYKHSGSLRHNSLATKDTGLKLVDVVFDASILPKECMSLRESYSAKRCLSLFRSCFLAGDYPLARNYYVQAIKSRPMLVTKWSYTLKFLRSFLKQA